MWLQASRARVLFVGEKVIAERLGYTRIRLLAPGEDSFKPFSKPIPLPT